MSSLYACMKCGFKASIRCCQKQQSNIRTSESNTSQKFHNLVLQKNLLNCMKLLFEFFQLVWGQIQSSTFVPPTLTKTNKTSEDTTEVNSDGYIINPKSTNFWGSLKTLNNIKTIRKDSTSEECILILFLLFWWIKKNEINQCWLVF